MADAVEFLLVGAGLASASCAARLRERGAEGRIVMVGREPDPPYDRPPLSKEYVRGESSREDAYVRPLSWYEDNAVELELGASVMSLDPSARTAKLSNKRELSFDRALIATGANVRILRVDGGELDGIHYLRTFGNSDAIRRDAENAESVVLIGGSYIGCELAASLTAIGKRCTIVMQEQVAMSSGFGEEVGRWFHDLLASHGVELLGGEELAAFVGDGERVSGIRTASGREVEADMVCMGTGVIPDTMLAKRAGLELEDGIVCDRFLRTSAEGIYAGGDVASYDSAIHRRRLRIEHWDVAMGQGRVAAENMMGGEVEYREVPYFWSDLADWAGLEYVGPAHRWDQLVWRGDPDAGEFTVWYLDEGRVAAALTVGRSEDLMHARRLLASGANVSAFAAALADPDADLETVAPAD